MTWLGFDELVRPLRPLIERLSSTAPLRESATAIVAAHYGRPLVEAQPILLNVGVLAMLSRGRPPVYLCRPSASRVVHETDLHSIPSEVPATLARPGVIEARRPETGERLFGDVAAIAWYPLPGAQHQPARLTDSIFVLGLRYPDGAAVARWVPAWTGEDLDEQLPTPDYGSSLIDVLEVLRHNAFMREASRYLVIFSILEQVENGPLRFEINKDGRTRDVRPKDLSARGHVLPPPAPQATALDGEPPEGRVLAETSVRGHLRRVRVGEGRSRVEWRYVEGFRANRWFGPRYTVERDHSHAGLANSLVTYRGGR